jgi:hypothetical protein
MGETMKKIAYVKVVLDDNVPEDMDGVIRCGSVISEDENGNKISDPQDLIDNTEYNSNEELIVSVAGRLGVDESIVDIIY